VFLDKQACPEAPDASFLKCSALFETPQIPALQVIALLLKQIAETQRTVISSLQENPEPPGKP